MPATLSEDGGQGWAGAQGKAQRKAGAGEDAPRVGPHVRREAGEGDTGRAVVGRLRGGGGCAVVPAGGGSMYLSPSPAPFEGRSAESCCPAAPADSIAVT